MSSETKTLCREITDEEVELFEVNGWVKLEKFIDPALAAELLEVAKSLMGEAGADHERRAGLDVSPFFLDYQFPAKEGIEPYASLYFSDSSCAAVRRLLDREIGVRYGHETIAARPGAPRW